MTDIANLFINMFNDDSKPTDSITDTALQYKNEKSKKRPNTPALNQGDKFLFYQEKIKKNLAKENKKSNDMFVEGFESNTATSLTDNADFTGSDFKGYDSITRQSKHVLRKTNMSSEEPKVLELKKKYRKSLAKYQIMMAKMKEQSNQYFERVSPKNPYLNKVIVFTTGHCCVVTNQGVVKYIPSWDYYTNATGITNPKLIYLDIPLPDDFWTPGTIVPTNPPLISGTTLTNYQKLGNEGKNVFVNEMISSDVTTSYVGVYGNNTAAPLTFIGGSPPVTTSLQNGNFDTPSIAANSYEYLNDSTTVPGWTFTNGVLMNTSGAWGYPTYPNGPQAASIQMGNSISQVVQLTPGTYTLSFMSCGRNCCDGSGLGNPINVQLNGTTVYTYTPSVTEWDSYSTSLNVTTSGSNTIGFVGTNTASDRSSAIQNVQLTEDGPPSGGTYTYDMCKQAATNNGYWYFGLQSVNSTASTGYCAVTNDYVGATQTGTSMIATATTALWASNTASSEVSDSGVTASLNNSGALCVYDSSGKVVYSSPNSEAQPGNYYGCYGDSGNRAMQLLAGGAQQFDLSGCQNYAIKNNFSYFGLQNSTSGTNAQCAVNNNFPQSVEYGIAGNCTKIADGSYSGGGWSNAVYNTWSPSVNYFLILQDDGNMVVYRGMGPSDNQGVIWASGTNGQQKDDNPAYTAAAGKYGRNYITTGGDTLAEGDFVGSTSGNMALVMQSDGNLVLYTWTMGANSQTMADGKIGGGQGATALYEQHGAGIPSNLGKLGYIDSDAALHTYPSDNSKLVNKYTKIPNTDSAGADYQVNGSWIGYGNSTVKDCKKTCNSYDDCYGFVTYNGTCYPKTGDMSYTGTGVLPGGNLYTRNKAPATVPTGASDTVVNTDSVSFQNYVNGGAFASEYGLASNLNSSQAQLSKIEAELNTLANEISSLTGQFETNNESVDKQIKKNMKGSDVYLSELQKTQKSIKNMSMGISNVLETSDIVVLQRNYDYMFWSVLAVGIVLVSITVVKK